MSAPVGARRLSLVRSLLGGAATSALLPEVVRSIGGDASTCLRLGAAFALGTLASEVPAALIGDRDGDARHWLRRAGLAQAIGLFAIAMSRDLVTLSLAVLLVGIGAGLATGAEARAALAIGGEARSVARLEVLALLGKGTTCCVVALAATLLGLGGRGALALSASLSLLAAAVASTLRVGDRVRAVRRGRRSPDRSGDRRRATSAGLVALLAGVSALGLAARGTDSVDAFAIAASGGGLLACALLFTAKGLIARVLAPSIARARLHGVALSAVFAAVALLFVSRQTGIGSFAIVAVACGIAGGAAAAARGVLLVRLGPERVGAGAAIEATARRVVLFGGALALASASPLGRTPYVAAAIAALFGAMLVVVPRTLAALSRARRSVETSKA